MKKILLLLLLIFPIVLSTCSDDDDDEKGLNSLQNTVWVDTVDGVNITLTFKSTDRCSLDFYSEEEGITLTYTYSYSLNYPNIIMIPDKDGNAELKGTITDNTIKLINTTSDEVVGFFIKKK